ncbi:hypothetical protein EIP91_006884 [Steccherinum ochraceum]|uniref:WLM domain-containing protein n=1 Tax=Steccherinum ochraceum TaxID=92696 RepID=A0A4V2MVH2_9APHY|nr:hypothetical protein EIP91_006884 [Steccherinum ochraceum]
MASSSALTLDHPANDITITVAHRGSSYPIAVSPTSLLADFQATIEDLTDVPIPNQKLLYKGKKTSNNAEEDTIEDAGLKDGVKVMLVGGTSEEVGGMRREEEEAKRRQRIDRERRAKPQTKVRSTGTPSLSNQYKFHAVRPHPLLPSSPEATAVLNRLANDPAIRHVMQVHKFTVGVLTEFAPHEHPDKLGYNTNMGQLISLRIRTNLYDGFRPYLDVRKVLMHELTHNVWSDHDNNFKELNSQLNREVLEHERSLTANTHTLGFDDTFSSYEPSSELEGEATSFVLGGGGQDSTLTRPRGNESPEERRRRVLEATMARLKKEEEELEGACGTTAAEKESASEAR